MEGSRKSTFQNPIDSRILHWSYWWKLCDDMVPLKSGCIRGKRQSFTPSGWQASTFRSTVLLQVFLYNVFWPKLSSRNGNPTHQFVLAGQRAQPSQQSAHPPHRCASLQPRNRQPWLFMDGFGICLSALAAQKTCLVGWQQNFVFFKGGLSQWSANDTLILLWKTFGFTVSTPWPTVKPWCKHMATRQRERQAPLAALCIAGPGSLWWINMGDTEPFKV